MVFDFFASRRAVYCGKISFSVLAATVVDMMFRPRFNSIPVSYVSPSFASFAVCLQFCLWALALSRLKVEIDFLILS